MGSNWVAILSASASTISASIAFFSLRGIRREKKKEALKELEVKKQHLLSLYDDLKYIKATMNSIAKGEENNPSNAIELTVQKMYNIKFLTLTEYGSYFDSRTSSALRAIRTAIVEHYSKFWYKNETDLFSSERYNDKDEKKEVIKDAKKRVEIIDNRIKILKRLLKIYNQEIRFLNKKWSVEILRFFK